MGFFNCHDCILSVFSFSVKAILVVEHPTIKNKDETKTETPTQTREKLKTIGGLWRRSSNDGKKKYLSGSLTVENEFGEKRRMKIIIFTNHWKEKETDQDYLIYFDGYLEPRKKDTKNDTNVDTKPEIKQNENDDDWSDKPTDEGTKKDPFLKFSVYY